MPNDTRRRNLIVTIIVLLIVLLLLGTCYYRKRAPIASSDSPASAARATSPGASTTAVPATTQSQEVLTSATVNAPAQISAGAEFTVAWTGPDNAGDFVTIVRSAASAQEHGHYRETQHGPSLKLTAPVEPGAYEVRYVTGRSRTILGRAPIEVMATTATLDAADTVILGAPFSVTWTGPDNKGDYITIVAKGAPDDQYGSYTNTDAGNTLKLTAPTTTGDAEVRYVTGEGRKVLARRPIRIVVPDVSVTAPDEAIAGSTIRVTWTGPNNDGDYITVVARDIPDGQYGNYTNTSKGAELELLMPILSGDAELRYMTGQGNKVLARRAIKVVPAEVKLSAAEQCAPGAQVNITWAGPNHGGDYITIVRTDTPDGQYAAYTPTSGGSPLTVAAPKEPCDAEIRYMTGQGNKVLARIPIRVTP